MPNPSAGEDAVDHASGGAPVPATRGRRLPGHQPDARERGDDAQPDQGAGPLPGCDARRRPAPGRRRPPETGATTPIRPAAKPAVEEAVPSPLPTPARSRPGEVGAGRVAVDEHREPRPWRPRPPRRRSRRPTRRRLAARDPPDEVARGRTRAPRGGQHDRHQVATTPATQVSAARIAAASSMRMLTRRPSARPWWTARLRRADPPHARRGTRRARTPRTGRRPGSRRTRRRRARPRPLRRGRDAGVLELAPGNGVLHDGADHEERRGDRRTPPRRWRRPLRWPRPGSPRRPAGSRAGSGPRCRSARPGSPGRRRARAWRVTRHTLPQRTHPTGPDRPDDGRPRTSRSGADSKFGSVSARCRGDWRGRLGELVGLVHEVDGDLAELVAVLAGVVGAEEELATGLELDAKVGLGSATVAAVRGAQRERRGQQQWSLRPHSPYHPCVWSNVATGIKDSRRHVVPDTSSNHVVPTRRPEFPILKNPRLRTSPV